MKRRRFLSGSPNHVYQRSLNGSVIFYSLEDCLFISLSFDLCSQVWCKRSWSVRDTVADEWQARKFLGLELPSKKRDV